MAILDSTVVNGDLTVTKSINGAVETANKVKVYSGATGDTAVYMEVRRVTSMPSSPAANTLYIVTE